jgi:cytochrome P450
MSITSLTSHWRIPARSRPLYHGSDGIWHVTGYAEARAILMGDVRQAGFKAETMQRVPQRMRIQKPVLFQDGAEHREQRTQTARFFTPTTVETRHLPLMETVADQIMDEIRQAGRVDLNHMAARMATGVVAEVVGLTESRLPELSRRLDRILHADLDIGLSLGRLPAYLNMQRLVFRFYRKDVLPAIRARRAAPKEDLISHLVAKGRRDPEILVECITYGAAGMVTTQEFICVAAWHMLREPELRERFTRGDRETKRAILYELLRIEPVVGHLFRRAAAELVVESEGAQVCIPAGAMIDLHIHEINADARAVGDAPFEFSLERKLDRGVNGAVMGFGSGPHRCVGEYLAIAESQVFLERLLALPGLRIVREPRLGRNETIQGYELRDFLIEADTCG